MMLALAKLQKRRARAAAKAARVSSPRILGPHGEFTVKVRGHVGKWMAWRLPSGTAVATESNLILDLVLILRDWLSRRLARGQS